MGMRSVGIVVLALSGMIAQRAAAETMAMCGQTIEYNIVAPAPDVPADIRAYSGIWKGDWANQLCGVLIVESIQKDGIVQTKYVYGTNPGWGIAKPGFNPWTGTIANGVLKLPPTRTGGNSVEYKMRSPTKLDGLFNSRTTGTFVKQ